jgi:hypothetical protein
MTDAAEEQAADNISESLRDRWEFGKLMLTERGLTKAGKPSKQLPTGRLDELVEATGKSRSELKYRAQFAERYPTEDEVANALATYTSWFQVTQNLPKPRTQCGGSQWHARLPRAEASRTTDHQRRQHLES